MNVFKVVKMIKIYIYKLINICESYGENSGIVSKTIKLP